MKHKPLFSRLLTPFAFSVLLASQGCELVGTQNAQDEAQTKKRTFVDILSSTQRPQSMLGYYSWVQRCSVSELMKEYEQLEKSSADDEIQSLDLRLALLLSLPEKPFTNDGRAHSMLKRYLDTKPSDDEDKAFALFLLDLLKERRRYKSQVESLESRVEDYQVVLNELQKERALRNKLENQVQQLKNIEENLIEREQVNMPPSKD